MIKVQADLLVKIAILFLGVVFCLLASAQNTEVDFRKEISGIKGAVIPEEISQESLPLQAQQLGAKLETPIETDISQMQEDQIPVLREKKSEAQSEESSIARILLTAGLLAALGIGSFFYLRRHARPTSSSTMQIKMLTQHHLGPRKSLAIIRVAGESILIGVTDHNISMIKSLSLLDEDLPEVNESNFSESLKKVGAAQAQKVDDEFSMQGIRDMVSKKLKNMKNLES